MTFPRLFALLVIASIVVDVKFNDGRLVDACWGQAMQFGYSFNSGLSGVLRHIAPG
jgi:hypothetical protein